MSGFDVIDYVASLQTAVVRTSRLYHLDILPFLYKSRTYVTESLAPFR